MHYEQYSDFLTRRTFRQSLLTHQGTKLGWDFDTERITHLYFSGDLVETEAGNGSEASVFKSTRGNTGPQFRTSHQLSCGALRHLSNSWPQALSFQELLSAGTEYIGLPPSEEDITALATNLIRLGMLEMASFFLEPWPFTLQISPRPAVSSLARYQAKKGQPLTTQHHYCEQLGNNHLQAEIISMLDGNHTPTEIANKIAQTLVAARQQITVQGKVICDKKGFAAFIHELVMELLPKLAKTGLLVK